MTIDEQRRIYDALDMCSVAHEHKKTNVFGSIFCLTDFYTFGDYEIEFSEYNPSSMLMPKGEVWIRKKESNGLSNLLVSWNEHHPEKQYVYNMYIAAKNRAEGKQFDHPFRLSITDKIKIHTKKPNLLTIIGRRIVSIVK